MTSSPTNPALLPPIAWQRGAAWGRDVTAHARGQHDRVANRDYIDALEETGESTIDGIVLSSRYRRMPGGGMSGNVRKRNLDEADIRLLFSGKEHEADIAASIATFIADGSRVISIGPDLVARAEADTEADMPLAELPEHRCSFYVHLEGNTATSHDGRPLDGFLVSFDKGDKDAGGHFHALPMTRENDPVDTPKTPRPNLCLKGLKGDVTIADAIRSAADRLIELMLKAEANHAETATRLEAHIAEHPPKTEAEEAGYEAKRKRNAIIARVLGEDYAKTRIQAESVRTQADKWARLIGTAIRCVAGDGPTGLPGFPPEAPADLVQRTLHKGPGVRKAEQRLVADGYPRWIRYETGQTMAIATVDDRAGDPSPPAGEASVGNHEEQAPTMPSNTDHGKAEADGRTSRRKERRLLRQQQRPAAGDGDQIETTDDQKHGATGTGEHAVDSQDNAVATATPPAITGWEDAKPVHSDALRADIDDLLRRCFRDLPAITARNWETTFPPALAAMVMRRVKVAQLPRENHDATRRRLAADILPRMEGLPDLIAQLRGVEARNSDRVTAYRIGRASIQRDVDPDVAEGAVHPILVSVVDDDDLARLISFPGVERDMRQLQDRTIVVRAWRVERTLHLMGIVHDGCLVGFRRVEHQLDSGETRTFDGDADGDDATTLLDALYAPIADAVLGPVDEADAWRYSRRRTRGETRTRQPRTPWKGVDEGIGAERTERPSLPAKDWTPVDEDFTDWTAVSRDAAPLGDDSMKAARDLMERNSVARAVLRSMDRDETDHEAANILNALARHLASAMANERRRIDAMTTPDIDDEASLHGCEDADGVLVVTDRALFEHASPGILTRPTANRETSLCIVYRLRRDGVAAMIIQPTAENGISLAQWVRFDLEPVPDESDLAWYLRGSLATLLAKSGSGEVTPPERAAPAILAPRPRRPPSPMDEAPRRVVAQARIWPQNLRIAVETASGWFDAQAARHGDALVEDVRNDGEWTIENEGEDRGVRSRWSVTLRPADEPGALDILVRSTLATGVKPRLPTLVREIAAATPTDGPDGRLLLTPPWAKTRSDFNELIRHLQSPDRQLPTLLMTQDQFGQYARDPLEVARQSLGAMNVRLIAEQLTYDLTDALGQEYRTFGGAVRLFQPRFDPDIDPASRHPRVMNDAGAERAIGDIISRATAATTTRYNIPDAVIQPTAQVQAPPAPADAQPDGQQPDIARRTPTSADGRIQNGVQDKDVEAGPETGIAESHDTGQEPELPLEPIEAVAAEILPDPEIHEPERVPEHVPPAERAARTDSSAATTTRGDTDGPDRAVGTPAHEPRHAETATPQTAAGLDMDALLSALDERISRQLDNAGVRDMSTTLSALVDRISLLDDRLSGIASDAEIEARDQEIRRLREEMRVERESALELLGEAETQRQAAIQEVETLRQAFNERRRGALRTEAATRWPSELSGLAEWLEHNVLPNVVIAPKAWRGMRRIRYTDMERLCRTLQLLDGAYIDMRAGEEGARDLWKEGLKELRLEDRKQGDMGKSIRGGAEYRFEFEGIRWEMDHHLRGIESLYNETDRLLRIYYTYDKQRGRVIIGHMPTHLTTIDS